MPRPAGADPLHEEVARTLSAASVPLSWRHPCEPSVRRLGKRARGDGRTPSEGGEGGAHEWTLRGYGRDAESEGAGMALTLPVSEHWTRGEAGGLVSFSWGGGVKAVLASRV